jgi:uncharacterized protein (TIGR03437 family)
MRPFSHFFAALVICTPVPLAAQPVIADQGITNSASYSILLANGGGLAPGSIMVIFGSSLGPATLQSAPAYPLGTTLAGTSVQIGDASAFLVYTSATQVAAVVPSSVQPGTHQVTVTYNNRTSPPVSVPVIGTDFGIFTRNAAGYGQAAAQTVLDPAGDVRTLGLATSIRPGEPVVLFGTGLGAIAGAPDDRPPGAARTTLPVEVVIAGRMVAPLYAGRSPNYAGLDQINFIAPVDLQPTCYVPVAVRAGGRLSNVASVPMTTAGRTCPHPFNLSEQSAARIDSGGTITIAQVIGERRSSEAGPVGEGMGIGFAEVDANSLEISVDAPNDPLNDPQPGICAPQVVDNNATVVMRPRVSRPRFLDAGSIVSLVGPSYSADLPRTPDSTYGMNLPTGTLRAGVWTFSSTGGADISPFQLASDLPEPLTWTNRQVNLNPAQPLRLDWTGGGSGPVNIVITTSTNSILCTGGPQDRTITVPGALMMTLPSGGTGGITFLQEITATGFALPLRRGGTVDGSLFRVEDQTSGTIRLP